MSVSKRLAVAFGLGGIYGLLALEAVSPLAIVLLIWAIVVLAWTWRLPATAAVLGASAAGFLGGFAAVWGPLLGHQLLTCKPPSCQAADPATDLLYGLAFTAPIITLAAAEIGLRRLIGTR
jgi:hypothetical protein